MWFLKLFSGGANIANIAVIALVLVFGTSQIRSQRTTKKLSEISVKYKAEKEKVDELKNELKRLEKELKNAKENCEEKPRRIRENKR